MGIFFFDAFLFVFWSFTPHRCQRVLEIPSGFNTKPHVTVKPWKTTTFSRSIIELNGPSIPIIANLWFTGCFFSFYVYIYIYKNWLGFGRVNLPTARIQHKSTMADSGLLKKAPFTHTSLHVLPNSKHQLKAPFVPISLRQATRLWLHAGPRTRQSRADCACTSRSLPTIRAATHPHAVNEIPNRLCIPWVYGCHKGL